MLVQAVKSQISSCKYRIQPYRDIRLIPYRDNREKLIPDNIILLSYPRSGNTWTRYLIADLVQQSLGLDTDTILPIEFWKVIPSIYTHSLGSLASDPVWSICKLVKSHEHQDLADRKAIYVIRRAEDSLCSWYHFNLNKGCINSSYISIDKFCRDHLTKWTEHVEAAIKYHESYPGKMLWVCYELLQNEPYACLTSISRFLGLKLEEIDIHRAIQNHEFKARKKVATKQELSFFIRKGKTGSSEEELQPRTRHYVRQRSDALYRKSYLLSLANINLAKN